MKPKERIVLFNDMGECCGCGACEAICPAIAIDMIEAEGFLFPQIDDEKCIKCRRCIRVCPFKILGA